MNNERNIEETISSNAEKLSLWAEELGEGSGIYVALRETAESFQRRDDRTNEETRKILRDKLKKLAQEQDLWVDNLDAELEANFGAPINMGGEALVYAGKNDNVIKSISLDYYAGNPIEALERIMIHNNFFPETALTDIGFGQESDGTFRIIVAQPYIENAESATHEEIQQYLKSLGLSTENGSTYYGYNVQLSDLNPKNVLKKTDEKGNTSYYVIDLEARNYTSNIEFTLAEYNSLRSTVSQVRDDNGEPQVQE